MSSSGLPFLSPVLFGQCGPASAPSQRQFGSQWVAISDGSRPNSGSHCLLGLHPAMDQVLRMCCSRISNTKREAACTASCGGLPPRNLGGLAKRGRSRYHSSRAPPLLEHMAFDDLELSPCYETMSLQIGLAGRDRFLVPFEANAGHIGNVKQSVTNFIWLL